MIWHDVEQNGEEWDALRLGKATASNFGLIMANDGKAFGEPAKRYALQLALGSLITKLTVTAPTASLARTGSLRLSRLLPPLTTPPSPAAPSIRHTDGNWSVTLIALAGIGWTSSATAQTSRTVSSSSSIALQLLNVKRK